MNSVSLPKDRKIVRSAEIVWDYMKLNHVLLPVDLIFVLGSRDDRVAGYAAELYVRGISKYILVSGGAAHSNDLLATKWGGTEAEHFVKIIVKCGVPTDSIILETKAMSTGDNILLGHEELTKQGLTPKSLLLVHKPYMERRTYAAFMKQWPGKKENILVSSPPIRFRFKTSLPIPVTLNNRWRTST